MKFSLFFMFFMGSTVLIGQTGENWKNKLDAFMDQWHEAAATANEDLFFGSMHPDGIYIGTDASEYWTREELRNWSARFFDRDTAWAFTPVSRNAYLHSSGDLIWFDELLDTWMGTCRASGIVTIREDGTYQIEHYHLSIAVPNDAVSEYLKIIGLSAKN